jgi:hypothetical protein
VSFIEWKEAVYRQNQELAAYWSAPILLHQLLVGPLETADYALVILVILYKQISLARELLIYSGLYNSRGSICMLSFQIGLILESLENLLFDLKAFTLSEFVFHQIVVQTPRLVNGSERCGRQVKLDHVVQNIGIDSLNKHVRFECTFGVSHGKGYIVPRTNVLAVVQAASRSVTAIPAHLEW